MFLNYYYLCYYYSMMLVLKFLMMTLMNSLLMLFLIENWMMNWMNWMKMIRERGRVPRCTVESTHPSFRSTDSAYSSH